MRPNKTKAKLAAGQVTLGYIQNIPAPGLVEVAGLSGMDFVVIDCEHGPMNEMAVEDMVRAAEVVDVTPIVRVPVNRPEVILRFMDRGAAGVLVPHVKTKADAEAAVAATKYAPMGNRGAAAGRWSIGAGDSPFEFANRETLVLCMVEEQEGVDNLEAILSVPGVDVIHIGPGDLAQSMGLIGQNKHPKVQQTMRHIITTCAKHGKPAGVGGNQPNDYDSVKEYIKLGARFVTIPPTGLLQLASREYRTRVLG